MLGESKSAFFWAIGLAAGLFVFQLLVSKVSSAGGGEE